MQVETGGTSNKEEEQVKREDKKEELASVKSWSFHNGSLSVTNSYKRRQQENQGEGSLVVTNSYRRRHQEENEEREQEHELAIARYRDRQLAIEQENDELLAEAEKYVKLYNELLAEVKEVKEQVVDKENELSEVQDEVSLLRKKQRLHEDQVEEHHANHADHVTQLSAKVRHLPPPSYHIVRLSLVSFMCLWFISDMCVLITTSG